MNPDELHSIRSALDWSQAKLAEELGVDRHLVIRWEQGLHPIAPLAALLITMLTPPAILARLHKKV